MYMAGKDKEFLPKMDADKELMEKPHKFFAGTMMDARRLMHPVEPTEAELKTDTNCSESDEE